MAAQLECHRAALAATAPGQVTILQPGQAAEKDAIARFNQFYEVYSADVIRAGVRDLYAADAYFGDPFRSVQGIDAIESYFLSMAEPVESCTFGIDGVDAAASGEYYIRWTMRLKARAARGDEVVTPGISHVRFNPQGQVIFQQDYWDSSTLLDRLPVVGFFTRAVKRRLE